MPPIRFLASKRRALLATSILLDGEITSPYFYYAKKGLVYIIITFPFNRQPSSYFKCIKANTRLLCDMHFVPLNKYIFRYCCTRYYAYCNLLIP